MQSVYDTMPIEDKKLFWIEGTTVREEAYRYFPEHPEQMLQWYAAPMKTSLTLQGGPYARLHGQSSGENSGARMLP